MSTILARTSFVAFATLLLSACNAVIVVNDGDVDSDSDLSDSPDGDSRLPVPFEPEPPAVPAIDTPFVQEFNHTSNEVEPGIGPLVAVVMPPGELADYPIPTQVTPRGAVRQADSGQIDLVSIPEGHPDLIAAGAVPGAIVLIGPGRIYLVTGAGVTEQTAPDGIAIAEVGPGSNALWLATSRGPVRVTLGSDPAWPATGDPITAVAEHDGILYTGSDTAVAAWDLPSVGDPQLLWRADGAALSTGPVRALVAGVSIPSPIDLVAVGDNGAQAFVNRPDTGSGYTSPAVAEFARDRVPLDRPRGGLRTSDGGLLIWTAGGACRLMDRGHGPEWRVYNRERWLPSEDVRGAWTDPGLPDGPIWFATAGGLATVTARRITIEQKLGPFIERIVQRHDRDGAVADSRLTRRGDLSSNVPYDSDNDGSWTSYWLVSECFRWKATGAPDARAHFDRSLEAMLRLHDLTGTDWFLARALIRKQGCILDDCDNPDDGHWYTSPDGEWWVKRDTSNDEVIAHVFMMGPAYDLCADETQKGRIRRHIANIIGGIIDHGYLLIDPVTLEDTTYGQWNPEYINDQFGGMLGDGGQRSVQMLAALTLARYLTGEQRFADAKRYLIDEHHYHTNAVHESEYPARSGRYSGDGNEMSTYGWHVLLRYEDDPALRALWQDGWRRTYANLIPQQAAWWDVVNAVSGGADPSLEMALRWLRLAPVDMIRWDQHNSHRLDLTWPPDYYEQANGGMRKDGFIIPYDERRCDRWNTDQYRVDGGMGAAIEMDGADVLAPYWMARYYRFIVSE